MFFAKMSDYGLIAAATKALDEGEWADARDLLDRLCLRGVRRAELPSLAETPGGEQLALRRPAYAELLSDRIREVNAGGRTL